MRVCFLTHYFPPEVGAPQTRIDVLARTLAQRGMTVTVHTGFPHYPSGTIMAPYRNRPWLREQRGGLKIVRSAVYPAANRGFGKRLADHASFGISALATAGLGGPADVVVTETPPLFTAAAGVGYARLKRAAHVVNVSDLWPASAVALGALRDHRAVAAASALERWIYARADLVVAPTEGIVRRLESTPAADGKVRRVWPVVDVERFDPRPPERAGGPLRVLFAGTVGLAHGVEVLVEASRLAGPDVIQTTIAGDGADAPRLRAMIEQRRVSNVRMIGVVGAHAIPRLYADADAGAVLLRDLELFRGALPTKLLETMAAGRPLLVAAEGEAAELTHTAHAGLVVAPGDPTALAQACKRLHDEPARALEMGRAGRHYAEAHFGAQRAADQWAQQLTDAVRGRRG